MSDEETRAVEYRRMMIARAKNKRAAEHALAGDAGRKAALDAKVAPLLRVDANGIRRGDLR